MGKMWTEKEFNFLKDNYMTMTDEELAKEIGRTSTQVKHKRDHEKLGRSKPNRNIDWDSLKRDYETEKDLTVLAKKYSVKTTTSIRDHLVNDNLFEYIVNKWSKDEFAYLRDGIGKISTVEMAQYLNRSIASVGKKISDLNLDNREVLYYYPNYIPYNEKEEFLYNKINEKLNNNELITHSYIRKYLPDINLPDYTMKVYDMGYDSFLKTFFNIDLQKYYNDNSIEIYNYYRSNNLIFPSNFMTVENSVTIVRSLLKNYSEEDFYQKYCGAMLEEFGLYNTKIFDFAKLLYPNYLNHPFLFKKAFCPNGYWDDLDNRFLAIDHMVENMINNKIMNSVDDVTRLTAEDFQNNNLGGLLTERLMYDILSEYLLKKTGKQYNECELHCVTNGYWKDIENVKKSIKWMLEEQEHCDGVDIEWIKGNFGVNMIKKYGLAGMLSSLHTINGYTPINSLITITYPDLDIFSWEFNMVSNDYWSLKETADQSLKQLIESRLCLPILDIPKYISRTYFQYNYQKFLLPLTRFYNGNIFNWINSIYPNVFTCRDFGYIECLDGTIVKSLAEQMIHNYLIVKYNNVKYLDNKKENEGSYENTKYIPDWTIEDNIVIEYLGLYKENKTNIEKYDKYNSKTKNKLQMGEDSELTFVFLYESDLKNNLQGLKTKIEESINNNMKEGK